MRFGKKYLLNSGFYVNAIYFYEIYVDQKPSVVVRVFKIVVFYKIYITYLSTSLYSSKSLNFINKA